MHVLHTISQYSSVQRSTVPARTQGQPAGLVCVHSFRPLWLTLMARSFAFHTTAQAVGGQRDCPFGDGVLRLADTTLAGGPDVSCV